MEVPGFELRKQETSCCMRLPMGTMTASNLTHLLPVKPFAWNDDCSLVQFQARHVGYPELAHLEGSLQGQFGHLIWALVATNTFHILLKWRNFMPFEIEISLKKLKA